MADTALHLNPPKQARSKRTLERIVSASLQILSEEGAGGLTVQAVIRRADSSVGSFYARFRGKDDLLEYLGERVWRDALGRWREELASGTWSEMGLDELARGTAGLLVDTQRSRAAYLSALDLAAPGRSAYGAFLDHILSDLARLLLERRADIRHEGPERAVRVALRAVMGAIEGDARAGPEALDREVLVRECSELMLAYLTGGGPRDGGASTVDFFDVWG